MKHCRRSQAITSPSFAYVHAAAAAAFKSASSSMRQACLFTDGRVFSLTVHPFLQYHYTALGPRQACTHSPELAPECRVWTCLSGATRPMAAGLERPASTRRCTTGACCSSRGRSSTIPRRPAWTPTTGRQRSCCVRWSSCWRPPGPTWTTYCRQASDTLESLEQILPQTKQLLESLNTTICDEILHSPEHAMLPWIDLCIKQQFHKVCTES